MPTVAQALTVVAVQPAPQQQIASYVDVREQAKAALIELAAEQQKVPADLAQQVVAQAAGKPQLDTDAVLALYKTAKQKGDQLQDKTTAIGFLLDAVNKRLDELKESSPADFIIVLRQRIAEQQKVTAKEQDEAQHAQATLDELNHELEDLVTKHPDAASSATAAPGIAAAAPATSAGAARTAAVASSRSRSRRTKASA
jgi:hypothetical protein